MGGSAPKPDPRMAEAAVMSAQTGQDMMAWMKDQAVITNKWAVDDRARDIEVFRPQQDQFIADAQAWDTPERQNQQAAAASADVNLTARQQTEAMGRDAAAMGIDPTSGRYAASRGRMATDTALGAAGAANLARRSVRMEGDARKAQAINLGAGFAVNPGNAMGISNAAGQSGFSGAMQGQGQMANILNQDYQARMQTYNANNASMMGVMSGIGSLAGAFMSSKKIKHDKKPSGGNLDAVKAMPVEQWTYNPGSGDGGTHVGPYAEDFAKETGMGDGKSIDVISMMGVTMGAVKELAQKVDELSPKKKPVAMGAMRRSGA